MVNNLSNDFMNEMHETNDQQTDGMDDKEDNQKQGNIAHRRTRERAQKELLEDAKRRKASAQRRASRPSIPNGEMQAQQQHYNSRFASKQNTPCAKTITMSYPDASTSSTPNLALSTKESPPESAPANTRAYTIGNDGNSPIFILLFMCRHKIPLLTRALLHDEGDMEAFLANVMHENPTGGDFMDDEYYLFGGEGTTSHVALFSHFQF
jgi:hypothetical protein